MVGIMVRKFITKGKGTGRKVIPIKETTAVKAPQKIATLTIPDLARLLVELMDSDEREDYVHRVIVDMLNEDKAYWSEQSKLFDISDDTDELAYAILDDLDEKHPKKFMELLLNTKKIELITSKSYYNLALDRFNNPTR